MTAGRLPLLLPALLLPALLLLALSLSQAAESKKGARTPSPARGKAVFQKHCAQCHATTGERKAGPGLKGLYQHPNLEESGDPVNDQTVRALIAKGAGGGEMPGFAAKIKPQEMADLLAYLRKL